MRSRIQTSAAPDAIGPYSQAIRTGDMVFLSGQIPLIPETMEMVDGDFEAQVRRVFDNLQAVCREAGGDLKDVVRFTIYLTDLGRFSVVNDIMVEYLDEPFPARATVQVSGDGGETWEDVDPSEPYTGTITGNFSECDDTSSYDGQEGWSGIGDGWDEVTVELEPEVLTSEFQVRFWFVSDRAATDEGWTIDDVEVRL